MFSQNTGSELIQLPELAERELLFADTRPPEAQSTLVAGNSGRQSAAWDLLHGPKNYLTLLIAQALTSLLSFASVWLTTRYLGPEGYGGVVAFIAAAQVVMLIGVNWTSISVARYGCEEFVQTGQIASTFWTRLIILVPNLVLVLATTPLWLPRLVRVLHLPVNATWLVLSLLLVNAWWIHIQQSLQGAKLLRLQGWLLTLERALIFLVLCYLAFSGSVSVQRVGWLYVLGSAGASLIGEDRLDGTPDYVVMADPEGTSFACFDQGVCPRGRAGRCWVGGRR